jgi:hypothetical protein
VSFWFCGAAFSAEPARMLFTSGLRHSFLDTGDLLGAILRRTYRKWRHWWLVKMPEPLAGSPD